MSSRSFRSVFMVASCAGAALSCYLVSLRVASERAALENVETRIVYAQRDLRTLQTEIGTRGRLSQLERWNAGTFALAAPSADQFLKGSFELARLAQPQRKVDFQAPVVLASAPAAEPHQSQVGQPDVDEAGVRSALPANPLLHQASLETGTREVPARQPVALPLTAAKPSDNPATAAKPVLSASVGKPGLAAAQQARHDRLALNASFSPQKSKNGVDKPALGGTKPVTLPGRVAKVDPLAPLAARHSGHSKDSAAER